MRGHIQLGPTEAELKDYLLVDPVQRVRSRSNPLSAQIRQGAGEFSDFTSDEYWEISNWARGIGYNADAGVEGGYLYGEVDSRSGSSFILPPLLSAHTAEDNADVSPSVINIDDGFTFTIDAPAKVAVQIYMDVPGDIYIYMDSAGVIGASICADNAGEPGTVLWSGSASSDPFSVTKEWTLISNNFTPTAGVVYWVVLEDDDGSFNVHGMTTTKSGGRLLNYAGATWGELYTQELYAPYIAGGGQLGLIVSAATVGDDLYTLADDGVIYIWNSTTGTFDSFADTAAASYDMQLWYGSLVVTHGTGTNMSAVNVTTAVVTALTIEGELLSVWNGYLWKSLGNVMSYSGENIADWTDIECGPDDYTVRGFAGLGDDVIVSTDQAIWRIAPGDWLYGLSRWAYHSANNGKGMVNNQGVVFIPADNSLIRMQANAPLINIWKREEALPASKAGIISGVLGTNKEVIIHVNATDAGGESTFWSFNNQGWHFVGKLPQGQAICLMHYDNANDSIWIFSDSGHAYSFYASATVSNPTNDALTRFMPAGWVDMGHFHGGLQTVIKDFDGVRVVGQSISPSKPVTIFWRDPASATTEFIFSQDGEIILQQDEEPLEEDRIGWSTLGKIKESGAEIRWTDYTTRPVAYGIQLAYSVDTDNVDISPEISAVVVKYWSHIRDQQRFQLPLIISNYQEMVDGTRDTRTGAEIMAEIEALEFDRFLPIWYRDIDERLFECKVIGFAERAVLFEKIADGNPAVRSVIDLTLQQIA